jgi:hypothetical protein
VATSNLMLGVWASGLMFSSYGHFLGALFLYFFHTFFSSCRGIYMYNHTHDTSKLASPYELPYEAFSRYNTSVHKKKDLYTSFRICKLPL